MNNVEKNNKLFKTGFWGYNACLHFSYNPNYGYVSGYKKATKILMDYVQCEMRDQDILIYPFVFLCRHHIELQLKEIIKKGAKALDIEFRLKNMMHHDIKLLWNECKQILQKLEPESAIDENKKYYNDIEKIIKQLSDIDPNSYTFRYSTNKTGNDSLNPEYRIINVKSFFEIIEETSELLDGAIQFINHFNDTKAEYKQEMFT